MSRAQCDDQDLPNGNPRFFKTSIWQLLQELFQPRCPSQHQIWIWYNSFNYITLNVRDSCKRGVASNPIKTTPIVLGWWRKCNLRKFMNLHWLVRFPHWWVPGQLKASMWSIWAKWAVEKQGCNLEMGGGVGLIDPPTDLIETVSAHFYTGDIFGYSDIFLSRILTKTKC